MSAAVRVTLVQRMLEGTRIVLFLTTLAAVALSVAMHLGRVDLRPWLRVLAYAALPIAVVLLVVAGLRGPRYAIPPKVPVVLKALVAFTASYATYHCVVYVRSGGAVSLDAAFASDAGRRAVASLLLVVYAIAFALSWRRVPRRHARM